MRSAIAAICLVPLSFCVPAFAKGNLTNELSEAVARFRTSYQAWDCSGFAETIKLLDGIAARCPGVFDVSYWSAVTRFHLVLHVVNEGCALGAPDTDELMDAVVASLDCALSVRPGSAECHAMLSAIHGMRIGGAKHRALTLGPKVLRHRKKALEARPETPRAYYLLGTSSFHGPRLLGGKKKSLALFRRACTLYEQERRHAQDLPALAPRWGYSSCLTFMAMACRDLDRIDEARQFCKKALSVNPSEARARGLLAELGKHNGGEQ